MSNILPVTLLIGGILSAAATSRADEKADVSNAKQKALAWIDDYRKKQVLFHDKDVERVRQELADSSPEEALQWWTKSAKIRKALNSKQWAETRQWLREFLRVQAIYSDQQVAQVGDHSPTHFRQPVLCFRYAKRLRRSRRQSAYDGCK